MDFSASAGSPCWRYGLGQRAADEYRGGEVAEGVGGPVQAGGSEQAAGAAAQFTQGEAGERGPDEGHRHGSGRGGAKGERAVGVRDVQRGWDVPQREQRAGDDGRPGDATGALDEAEEYAPESDLFEQDSAQRDSDEDLVGDGRGPGMLDPGAEAGLVPGAAGEPMRQEYESGGDQRGGHVGRHREVVVEEVGRGKNAQDRRHGHWLAQHATSRRRSWGRGEGGCHGWARPDGIPRAYPCRCPVSASSTPYVMTWICGRPAWDRCMPMQPCQDCGSASPMLRSGGGP